MRGAFQRVLAVQEVGVVETLKVDTHQAKVVDQALEDQKKNSCDEDRCRNRKVGHAG